MTTEMSPKAEITVDVTLEEYTTASLLTERRYGSLHSMPFIVLLAAGLLLIGLCSMNWFRTNYQSILVPMIICSGCPILLLFIFWMIPNSLKKRAQKDYLSYQTLMQPSKLGLYVDTAITTTPYVKLTDPYALMVCCIETPSLIVFIKDRERLLVLPKRCLPSENKEEIIAFIRLVFARHRRAMQNWIF